MDKIPSPSIKQTEEKYLKYLLKSLKQIESKKLEKAAKLLKFLLQLTSKPAKYEISSLNNLSIIYSKQRNFKKSYILLEKALSKLKPQPPSKELLGTLINISSLFIHQNQFIESAAFSLHAKQLISYDPKLLPLVNYNLSLAYLQTSKFQEGKKILKQTLAALKDNLDPELTLLIKSAYSYAKSRSLKELELKQLKSYKELKTKKDVLKNLILQNDLTADDKKSRKPFKSLKRSGSQIQHSFRNTHKLTEKQNSSNTSSTDSVNNASGCLRSSKGSSKTMKRLFSTENFSKTHSSAKQKIIGCRIQSIEDQLTSIELKINHFAEQCKPLVTLTEDPDENLDSNRGTKAKPEKLSTSHIGSYLRSLAALESSETL